MLIRIGQAGRFYVYGSSNAFISPKTFIDYSDGERGIYQWK